MEDVLEVYHRPYDARFPQVCMDEGSKQLLADKREGEPMEAGKPARYDNEYERHGTISVFVACEPKGGQTHDPASASAAPRRSGPRSCVS